MTATPLVWPQQASGQHPADSWYRGGVRPLLLMWLAVLLSVTVLQRFAIPGTGEIVGVGFAGCVAVAGWAVIRGYLRIDPVRFGLYGIAVACLLVTLFARSEQFSSQSLFMLLLLYLPFILMVEVDRTTFEMMLEIFQRVMILSAIVGILQFGIQFLLGPDAMFPFDLVLPPGLFIQGFNLRIGIQEGLGLLKSNGLWFLEPSHFSQMLAIGIIIEILQARRPAVLALFATAYIVSFSGTGAMLLLAMVAPLAIRLHYWWLLILPLILLLSLPWLQDVPPFSMFLDRLDEFGNPMSSGSMRMFGPYWLVSDVLVNNPRALFFGFGPGSVEAVSDALDYAVQDSSWLKLLVEYGIIGSAGFSIFYLYALFRHAPDRLLALACLFQFMFLGGYLNAFYIQFLHMALVIWPRLRQPALAGSFPRVA